MKIDHLFTATAMAGVLTCLAGPAFAQATGNPVAAAQNLAAPDPSDAPAETAADVVVTGSRIARPNDNSTVPVTTLTAAELQQTGNISTGDVLNDLPALRSTFSQANSTRFLGTAGLNMLDLRGLGTQRTLVLVNGRRHVGADILANAVTPDINTFPTDLIERVDVVTGGDSAIYGSDAIAGVVNFVLKDHFAGLQLHAQGGMGERGDAGSYYASALVGRNFAGGRGNIALDVEYARQNSLYGSQRAYLAQNDAFVTVDADPAGTPNGSDGNPDSVFFRDIHSATIANGGLIAFASPTGACGRDSQLQANGRGRAFTCNYLFQSDGTLVAETGTRVGLSSGSDTAPTATPGGAFIGGNGSTRREGKLVQVQPQLTRYAANLIGHFDVSDAFVPFFEAKYVRTDSLGSGGSGPAFITGTTTGQIVDTGTTTFERPRLDNPFLSAQARQVITDGLIAAGTDPAAITGATRFSLRENLLQLGVRTERARRETYRAVIGARGRFNDDWHYEASVNYGEFREKTRILGNLNLQRFLLGMDAVRNAAGQIVCGSQVDVTRGGHDAAGNPGVLAADIAACQPVNPFGDGNISQAAKNYVLQDTVSRGKITQFVMSGFISGDSSKWFNLPGGPVGVAIGGEYRREKVFFQQDPLVQQGYTFYNAINTLDPPSFAVKEAYAELRLPILKDSFIKELTITGAGRVANYKGSTGTVYSYNGGLDFAPIPDIRFRANYSRAVRAPNLTDLFTPQSQNFATITDPCSADNLGRGTQYRAPNCTAAGRPSTYNYVYASSLGLLSGGNPNLKAETSDSYTYGAVVQPRFVPGLTLSVDYYNIKVNNVITTPTAQQIINTCYDSPTAGNQFCSLFQRAGAGGGPNGEEPFRIIENSLHQTLFNYAKLQTRGIDVDVNYRHRVGGIMINSHLVYTHSLQADSFVDPTQPGFADTVNGELGNPKDAFNWNIGFDTGRFFASYQMRYLSPMVLTLYENQYSFQGRPAQNADEADILAFPSVFYHDVRFGVNFAHGSNFYFGIDNLMDKRPPLASTAIGGGSGIYESIGRRFYAGITAKF